MRLKLVHGLCAILILTMLFGGWQVSYAAKMPSRSAPANLYCDSIHAEYPAVVKVGSLYYAYYSGFGCSWLLHYASSVDGIHFDKQGLLDLNDGWSEQQAFPFALYEDGRFKLWYGGGLPYRIGYAESVDGVHFFAQPQPVLDPGPAGSWDAGDLVRPSILKLANPAATMLQALNLPLTSTQLYLMYYNAFSSSNPDPGVGYDTAIGLAASLDGLRWQRYDQNPIITSDQEIYTCFALRVEGAYYLYYRIAGDVQLSTSIDGLHFATYAGNPVLSRQPNTWQAEQVYGVFILPLDDGSYRMYYNGIRHLGGGWGMIGIASSTDLIHFTSRSDNPAITVGNTPANFTASANPDGTISASWHRVLADDSTYELRYGTSPGNYDQGLAVSTVESITFLPLEPSPDGSYYLTLIGSKGGEPGYPAEEQMVQVAAPCRTKRDGSGCPTSTATASSTATATASPTATVADSATASSTASTTAVPTATPTATTPACTVSFSDVPASNIFYSDIQYLACRGLVSGFVGGAFQPDSGITRAQFAKIMALSFNLNTPPPNAPAFSDVPTTNIFYPYIEAASTAGLINGLGASQCQQLGTAAPCYGPDLPVSRVVVAVIVQRERHYPVYAPTAPTFADLPPTAFGYSAVESLVQQGINSGGPCGDGSRLCYLPSAKSTRGETSKVVHHALLIAP